MFNGLASRSARSASFEKWTSDEPKAESGRVGGECAGASAWMRELFDKKVIGSI